MPLNTSLVLDRGGTSLDHIAIGVPDTQQGVRQIAEMTGVEPLIREPEPDQFYWSGAIPLGHGRFLEILGPNPHYKKFNPFIEAVRKLETPHPIFWYVATDDFDAFGAVAKAAKAPLQRIESIRYERDGDLTDYRRAIMGPGFRSTRPCVIQWNARSDWPAETPELQVEALRLFSPEAERLRQLFDHLGIDQKVENGPEQISLTLGTPKGSITLAGPGMVYKGLGAMAAMASMYLSYLLRPKK
ncbi:MAG: VOC family protein [Pseudomonadota bacterium]